MAIPNANIQTPNFVAALPSIIDYGEQRCYRELDLLQATEVQLYNLTPLQRTGSIAAPVGQPQILILETVCVVAPWGERIPVNPTTKEWLDAVYGGPQHPGRPRYFALLDDQTLYFGPWPDRDYTVEYTGTFRPTPLYAAPPGDGTQTTFLANVLPDLFLAACMVAASGYQKNFGSQSDNPQQAQSWENQYQTLFKSAATEELRKNFHGWQALSSGLNPPPTPPPPPPGG